MASNIFFIYFLHWIDLSTAPRTISTMELQQDALLEAYWQQRVEPRLLVLDVLVSLPSPQPLTTG